MEYPEQKQAVCSILGDYAKALNSADIASITAFFTSDGKFMPEAHQTITKPDVLRKAAENYLVKSDFSIDYTIEDILIESHFAFVIAQAKTSQKDEVTGAIIAKSSRDFFVLKQIEDSWKIYRYVFNDVKIRSQNP